MQYMNLIKGQKEIGCRASKSDLSISVMSSLSVISLDSLEAEALILMAVTNLEPCLLKISLPEQCYHQE